MVTTRTIKPKFSEGEKVLCYEPDVTKAKVLYDSKVLGIVETKDKKGKKTVQYKIHFQGWNSSWDREVNSDFVLKDTDENRQLQKDLAEKAQLQLAAYLYRRERKKRCRKENNSDTSSKSRNRLSSEDRSICSTFERSEFLCREDFDSESCSSSTDSMPEDRVTLQISRKLKNYLEYDLQMITSKKLHKLPAKTAVITILENFVKQMALKLLMCPIQKEQQRKRCSHLRSEKRDRNMENLRAIVSILQEVADGLRIYFDFTLKDYLLYEEEREQFCLYFSENNSKNLKHIAFEKNHDLLQAKTETFATLCRLDMIKESTITFNSKKFNQNPNRRLRSGKSEESESFIDINIGRKQENHSFSSANSAPQDDNVITIQDYANNFTSTNIGLSVKFKELYHEVNSWQLLPRDAEHSPSMVFGAVHLARLIVKMPEFLNLSAIPDKKLKVLLHHLDSFALYLEEHQEWFNEQNYKDFGP